MREAATSSFRRLGWIASGRDVPCREPFGGYLYDKNGEA